MRSKYNIHLLYLLVLMMLWNSVFRSGESVLAETKVSDFSALEELLEKDKVQSIYLSEDIALYHGISIRGKKIVVGNGHMLYRDKSNTDNLFEVKNATLQLEHTILSGKKIRQEDAITALWIKENGKVTMNGGALTEHENAAGGAALRVEKDGFFEIKSGSICQNSAIATGKKAGKDARGGAIANKGTVLFSGGTLSGNQAIGYKGGNILYGGIGGLIYNQGECIVKEARIRENQATLAGINFYHEEGAVYRKMIEKESQTASANEAENTEIPEKDMVLKQEEIKKNAPVEKAKKQNPKKAGKNSPKKKLKREAKTTENKRKTKKNKEYLLEQTGNPRFFFLREVQNYSKADWRRELQKGCQYVLDNEQVWEWDGLLENKAGSYSIHAPDMNQKKVTMAVTIVSEETAEKREASYYARFVKPQSDKETGEIWHFSSTDIKAVKDFLREQNSPLSRESNEMFYQKFAACREK